MLSNISADTLPDRSALLPSRRAVRTLPNRSACARVNMSVRAGSASGFSVACELVWLVACWLAGSASTRDSRSALVYLQNSREAPLAVSAGGRAVAFLAWFARNWLE